MESVTCRSDESAHTRTHTHAPKWREEKKNRIITELNCSTACRTVSHSFHRCARSLGAPTRFLFERVHCVLFNVPHAPCRAIKFSKSDLMPIEKLPILGNCGRLFSTLYCGFGIYKILISKRARNDEAHTWPSNVVAAVVSWREKKTPSSWFLITFDYHHEWDRKKRY